MSTKKQTKKQTKKGFTLVEVIVVAVIVAILAAVAIPIYQQYVTDSRLSSVQNGAGALASFAGACNAKAGTNDQATTGTVTCTMINNTTTSIEVPLNTTANWGTAGQVTLTHNEDATATYTVNY